MAYNDVITNIRLSAIHRCEGGHTEKCYVSSLIISLTITFIYSYVASWKKKVESKEERRELQRQISSARDKRKHAALFAVVKHLEGRKNISTKISFCQTFFFSFLPHFNQEMVHTNHECN